MALLTIQDMQQHCREAVPGDIVIGEMTAAHQNAARLIDLMQRGVVCIPSPLAQMLSRSKVAQVDILSDYMVPLTLAIRRRKELLDAIGTYSAAGIGPVVTKEEHMHCGHGVRRWEHIETLYSFRGLEKTQYPFVLQPLVQRFRDVRVIIVGDYAEAYERCNANNFRGNLSSGACCSPYALRPEHERFCRVISERAGFPYAHLDLQIMPDGRPHLLEISLNGGMRGSRITRMELDRRKAERLRQLAEQYS